MYDIIPTQQFKRDVHKLKERGYDISLATEVISLLAAGIELPQKNKEHKLKGGVQELQGVPYCAGLVVDIPNKQ